MSILHSAVQTHLKHDRDNILLVPGSPPRPHFKHDASQTPNVDLGIIALLVIVQHLGCHPKYRPLHRSESSVIIINPIYSARGVSRLVQR